MSGSYCTVEYANEYFGGRRLHAEIWEQAEKQVNAAEPAWEGMSYSELKAAAKEAGIQGYTKMSKDQLIEALKSR